MHTHTSSFASPKLSPALVFTPKKVENKYKAAPEHSAHVAVHHGTFPGGGPSVTRQHATGRAAMLSWQHGRGGRPSPHGGSARLWAKRDSGGSALPLATGWHREGKRSAPPLPSFPGSPAVRQQILAEAAPRRQPPAQPGSAERDPGIPRSPSAELSRGVGVDGTARRSRSRSSLAPGANARPERGVSPGFTSANYFFKRFMDIQLLFT